MTIFGDERRWVPLLTTLSEFPDGTPKFPDPLSFTMVENQKEPPLKTTKDVEIELGGMGYLSLSKLVDKPIKDVVGFVTTHGGSDPYFNVSRVLFEDGTDAFLQGYHDTVILEDYGRLVSQEQLDALYEDEEEEE